MFQSFNYEIDDHAALTETFLDVPFVPTDENIVEAMLDLANVGSQDVLYDLGSGDGRILIAAARDRNTRGIGVELDPLRVADAMEEASWAGVECLVDFIEEDIFQADVSEATVVTLYLLQSVNVQLRDRLLRQLRPGARIVSHAFSMGEWRADDWLKLDGISIFKWVVPARVAGLWEWKDGEGRACRVALQQKYQEVTGSAWLDDVEASLEAALCGDRLEIKLSQGGQSIISRSVLTFENERIRAVEFR